MDETQDKKYSIEVKPETAYLIVGCALAYFYGRRVGRAQVTRMLRKAIVDQMTRSQV